MELYWWLRLAQLHEIAGVLLVIFGIGLIIAALIAIIMISDPFPGDGRETIFPCLARVRKTLYIWIITCLLICFLCPDRKDLAIMFGWDALHSKTAKEVFDSVKERLLP